MSATDVIGRLKYSFQNNHIAIIHLYGKESNHAILAYGMFYDKNIGGYIILAYDPNDPGTTSAIYAFPGSKAVYYPVNGEDYYIGNIESSSDLSLNIKVSDILKGLIPYSKMLILIDPVYSYKIINSNGSIINSTSNILHRGDDYELISLPYSSYNFTLYGSNYYFATLYRLDDNKLVRIVYNISTNGPSETDSYIINPESRKIIITLGNNSKTVNTSVTIFDLKNDSIKYSQFTINLSNKSIIHMSLYDDIKDLVKVEVDVGDDGVYEYNAIVSNGSILNLSHNKIFNADEQDENGTDNLNLTNELIKNSNDKVNKFINYMYYIIFAIITVAVVLMLLTYIARIY